MISEEKLDSIAYKLDGALNTLFNTHFGLSKKELSNPKQAVSKKVFEAASATVIIEYTEPRVETHLHELGHGLVGRLLGFQNDIRINADLKVPVISDIIEKVSGGYITYDSSLSKDVLGQTRTYGPQDPTKVQLSSVIYTMAGPFMSSFLYGFLIEDGWKRRNLAGVMEQIYGWGYLAIDLIAPLKYFTDINRLALDIGSVLPPQYKPLADLISYLNIESVLPPHYKALAVLIPYLTIPAGAVIGYKFRDGLSYVQNKIHQAQIENLIKNGKPYYDPVAMRGLYEE